MTLSYAGISLYVPTNEQQVGIQAWLDSWSDLEFAGHPWPGKDLTGMTFLPTQPYPHPKIGSLYWPFGASRWAVGHFLATDNQLAQIRVTVYPGLDIGTSDDPGDGFVNSPIPAPLVMLSKAVGAPLAPVTASLYMLPPRPIHQIQGANGLNLLTLVDQRYFWWYVDSDIQPISSATTWTTIYGNLADQLSLTINVDPISSSYFFPAPEFTNYYQNLPTMLDAVAYNCGQRIVCSLAGAVSAQNVATDAAILQSNITNMNMYGAKLLGGAFNPAFDFPEVLPKAVHNVTPIWLNGVPTVLDPLFNSQEVVLLNQNGFNAATGFYNFTGVRGFDGIKTFRDTFHGVASDFAGEIALAQQIALDYWQRIAMAYLDVTVAHPFTITPEGLHDLEWSYVRDRVSTRIYKTLWNWEPEEFLHGDGNGPFYGNSQYEPFQIQPFFAKVGTVSGTAYPWTEVIPQTGGIFTTKPSGRTGTVSVDPAYEFNLSNAVAPDSIVLMWRGFQNPTSNLQEWLFAIAGGNSVLKLRGTLTGTLTFGGSTTMTVAGTGATLTVNDWLLSSGQTVASGKQVTAFLDANGNWYVDGAQCP